MNALRGMLVALALAPALAAGAKGQAPVLGLGADRVKLGDSTADNALYGGGQHNIARVGSMLFVAYPYPDGDERELDANGQYVGTSPRTALMIAMSPDGGATWLPSRVAVRATGLSPRASLPLAIGPDPAGPGYARLHLVFRTKKVVDIFAVTALNYTHATLAPDGSLGAFSNPLPMGGPWVENDECSVAADDLGGVHVAFVSDATESAGVTYGRSADYGDGWAQWGDLVAPGGRFPTLAATATGEVFLAYAAGSGSYVMKRAAGALGFGAPVLATPTGGGEISLAAADASRLYLAWVSTSAPGSQTTFHVAASTDGGASWGTPVDGPPIGTCLFGPSVAVSPTGVVGVAWTDYCSNQLGYARSTDWTKYALLPSGRFGASLVFDAAGKASIAFVGATGDGSLASVFFTNER